MQRRSDWELNLWRSNTRVLDDKKRNHDLHVCLSRDWCEYGTNARISDATSFGRPGIRVTVSSVATNCCCLNDDGGISPSLYLSLSLSFSVCASIISSHIICSINYLPNVNRN